MVFSSIVFLGLFLPLFLSTHYLMPGRWRNWHIISFSLLFYAIGSGPLLVLFLISILLNYTGGWLVDRGPWLGRQTWLSICIAGNLAMLGWFKYANFFVSSINNLLEKWGGAPLGVVEVALPIGISFFTFQGIAYLIDVYRRGLGPVRRLSDFAVFIACFPQLIAGPIVRYQDVAANIRHRPLILDRLLAGFSRFGWGLLRKLVLADPLGAIADRCFAMPAAELSTSMAWLGLLCYALQIYHDFSGYSDMAIGMGRMLGFSYPENFDQPYRSRSITEFWRRWHMTLSSWFREYLYIPLGGNRSGSVRTHFNLVIVFLLCGLWHGAAWTFILWGIYHGTLLVAERWLNQRFGLRPQGLIGWCYCGLTTLLGWVLFRADSPTAALTYYQALLPHSAEPSVYSVAFFLTPDRLVFLGAALAVALVPMPAPKWWRSLPGRTLLASGALLGYLYSLVVLSANGFNPFIYFRF